MEEISVEDSSAQKKRAQKMISDMQRKMVQIDKIKQEYEGKKIAFSSPQRAKIIIEEIRVPPLELIKDEAHKKHK